MRARGRSLREGEPEENTARPAGSRWRRPSPGERCPGAGPGSPAAGGGGVAPRSHSPTLVASPHGRFGASLPRSGPCPGRWRGCGLLGFSVPACGPGWRGEACGASRALRVRPAGMSVFHTPTGCGMSQRERSGRARGRCPGC